MKKKYTAASAETKNLTPDKIEKLSEAEAIRAYNELRSVASRRLAALKRAGYLEKHPEYASNVHTESISALTAGKITEKAIKEIQKKGVSRETAIKTLKVAEVKKALPELAHYVRAGKSVRKLQKEAREDTERTATWLKKMFPEWSDAKATREAKAMGKFFDTMYEEFGDKSHTIGSPILMDMWEDLHDIGVNMTEFTRSKKRIKEAFDLWSEHDYEFRRIARGEIDSEETSEEDLKELITLKSELLEVVKPKKRETKKKKGAR